MRIGIACEGETNARQGFETARFGEIGGLEIYKAVIRKNGGKRRFLRRIKKCAEELQKLGISLCAAAEEFQPLQASGITVFSSGERIILERAGELALAFAEAHGIQSDFLICGGSFSHVTQAAERILSRRRYLYIENAAFGEIAEFLFESVGVSVGQNPPKAAAELHLGKGEKFLRWGDITAQISDFKTKLPGEIFEILPEGIRRPLAEMLEISGVLQKNEIKVEYFSKENF